MADFYFLNTGNTSFHNGANWSAADGGAPANTVPAAADNIFFTAGSGTGIVSSGVTVTNATFTGFVNAFILNASFTVTNTIQVNSGGINWTGSTFGFTTRNFINLSGTGATSTLIAGLTYLVKEKYIRTSEKGSAHGKVISSTPGTKAILTVTGDTNIGYVDFTDIDASGGRTLYPFNGVVTNCNNIISMTDKFWTNKTVASSAIV